MDFFCCPLYRSASELKPDMTKKTSMYVKSNQGTEALITSNRWRHLLNIYTSYDFTEMISAKERTRDNTGKLFTSEIGFFLVSFSYSNPTDPV
jgi:hypothetical protein